MLALGFLDPDAATACLDRLGEARDPVLDVIGSNADPDAALEGLERLRAVLAERGEADAAALLTALQDDEGTASRLVAVLGASEALADHLVRHPEHWRELTDPTLGTTRTPAYWMRECLLRSVGADPHDPVPVATLPDHEALAAMRVEYRRLLLRLASRDLAHDVGVDDVAAELADLAAGTLDAALAVARQRVGEDAAVARLGVVAMGKCGGRELNYVSDVDVMFVHASADPDVADDDPRVLRAATRLAGHVVRVCSEHTGEGTLWEVDANLRPEGKQGPLSRTLDGFERYYDRWAKGWEFQALLKARPVAGDVALAGELCDRVAPLVWTAAERDGFVADTQAMRRRVVEHIPSREAARELKLGDGGLRDVEFAVQLLQLVHARTDERIRCRATLSALWYLTEDGYVGREDGETLFEAYVFLRRLEHRIQLHRLRRTHQVPDDEASLRRLGRSLGLYKDSAATLERTWQQYRLEVRRLHQKIFYRPLLTAVARVHGDEVRLSSEAAGARLAALGYVDPQAALRNLEAMTAGLSRAARVRRALLPAMLSWFAEGPDPDAGLFGFRRLSEALDRTPWYLSTLRDEGQVAERLAHVLSTSAYVTSLLEREPEGVRLLGTPLEPLDAAALLEEMSSAASRHDEVAKASRAVRAVRRRELFRVGAGDLLGVLDVERVGRALSRVTDATLEATLEVAGRHVRAQRGIDEAPTAMAVVAMGRYGGFELSYGSDADVMFVHRPHPEADPHRATQYATAVANEVRSLLAAPGPDPALTVDADLRPEGRQGPLVRTLDSYAAYYARWSEVWEAQALLRADPVVGDASLRADFAALVDPLRYPEGGLSADGVVEVRRIKARVDSERLPRGADRDAHLKLGRGGLADIEWTVQLLQLRHAADVEGLRTPRTLPALAAAAEAGLVDQQDADRLADAWRTVSRVRNAVTLARGAPSDELPRDPRDLAVVAHVLGYEPGHTDAMVNDLRRVTRRARQVVERVFW